jgi:hypothetical protein
MSGTFAALSALDRATDVHGGVTDAALATDGELASLAPEDAAQEGAPGVTRYTGSERSATGPVRRVTVRRSCTASRLSWLPGTRLCGKPTRSPGARSGGVLLCGRQLPGEVAGVRREVCWLGRLAGGRLFRPGRSR